MPKWLKNNFVTVSNQPVKNAPLIRYVSALLDIRARRGQKVHLQYVKGHSGIEGNEGADRLANRGTTRRTLPLLNLQNTPLTHTYTPPIPYSTTTRSPQNLKTPLHLVFLCLCPCLTLKHPVLPCPTINHHPSLSTTCYFTLSFHSLLPHTPIHTLQLFTTSTLVYPPTITNPLPNSCTYTAPADCTPSPSFPHPVNTFSNSSTSLPTPPEPAPELSHPSFARLNEPD